MKCIDFIEELFTLTADYDGDGNGLCGESYEEVVSILKTEYPILFEAYKMLKEVDVHGKMCSRMRTLSAGRMGGLPPMSLQ